MSLGQQANGDERDIVFGFVGQQLPQDGIAEGLKRVCGRTRQGPVEQTHAFVERPITPLHQAVSVKEHGGASVEDDLVFCPRAHRADSEEKIGFVAVKADQPSIALDGDRGRVTGIGPPKVPRGVGRGAGCSEVTDDDRCGRIDL